MNSVVFAKTHKTGGSTLGSIIARYGHERNLSIALPRNNGTVFGTRAFKSSMLFSRRTADDKGFHILFNHVRFNKTTISDVMRSEVKFITILRDPVRQFYSAVTYFDLQDELFAKGNLSSSEFDLRRLLWKIKHCKTYRCSCTYNGQSADLGVFRGGRSKLEKLDKMAVTTDVRTQTYSEQVEKDFSLVLILEYLDESLILLRKLLCWEFMDILYISKKENSVTVSPSAKHKKMVRAWNYADTALYNHFNRTLWKKIEDYGPTFHDELKYFRLLRKVTTAKCEASNPDRNDTTMQQNVRVQCANLLRDIKPYTALLRNLQDMRITLRH